MEYVIKTKRLKKKYDAHYAVKGVELHVPKGKIYGLLGRNGAGKTTVMKMLLNLIRPSEGEILLFNEDYLKNRRRTYGRIGSLIETPGFYGNLTGFENLGILAKLRGEHRKDSILNALKTVGLENEPQKRFSAYSVGMKQRLGIAAAVMHEPELLILDEPINGLDPVGIAVIRDYLDRLRTERGVSIMLSSHILSEIEQLADIVGVIHKGELLEEVSMEELHARTRQYVEFIVSDSNKMCLLLSEELKLRDFSVLDNHAIRLYTDFELRPRINALLVNNGIDVFKMALGEDKLEDYFRELIGGGEIG